MAAIVAKIFISKTFGLLMPLSITFKLLTFPILMTILSIYVKPVREFIDNLMGLKIKKSEFGFMKFFNSSKVRNTIGLLILLWLLLGQLIFAPLLHPGDNFDFKSGKFTTVPISGVPKILLSIVLLMKGPFKMANFLLTTKKLFLGSVYNPDITNLTRIIGLLIGFFMVYIIKRAVTALDLVIALFLTIISLFTPIFDILFKMIQIRLPKITAKSILTRSSHVWIGMLFAAFWLCFTFLVIRNIPGYEVLNEKVSEMIDGETTLLTVFLNFITYLVFPLFIASKLSESLSKKGKTLKEKKKLYKRGFTIGYIIGLLIMMMIRNLIPGSVKDKIEEGMDKVSEKIPGIDEE